MRTLDIQLGPGEVHKSALMKGETLTITFDTPEKMLASTGKALNANYRWRYLSNRAIEITALDNLLFTFTCYSKEEGERAIQRMGRTNAD